MGKNHNHKIITELGKIVANHVTDKEFMSLKCYSS